jgi:hypothetical protein
MRKSEPRQSRKPEPTKPREPNRKRPVKSASENGMKRKSGTKRNGPPETPDSGKKTANAGRLKTPKTVRYANGTPVEKKKALEKTARKESPSQERQEQSKRDDSGVSKADREWRWIPTCLEPYPRHSSMRENDHETARGNECCPTKPKLLGNV